MLKVKDLGYRYTPPGSPSEFEHKRESSEAPFELKGINLEIHPAELLLILGRNGSGKTTLVKHLNGLLLPHEGEVLLDGLSTRRGAVALPQIRRRVGLVFQNTENQIVGQTVEEEVAFGPENLNLPSSEIRTRVLRALEVVGLLDKAKRSPMQLSGGEQKLLAIASVLAMEPEYIILDEPFTMLDQAACETIWRVLEELKAKRHGIILVSHEPEHIEHADRVALLKEGELVFVGSPQQILKNHKLESAGLLPPDIVKLFYALNGQLKAHFTEIPLSVGAMANILKERLHVGTLSLWHDSSLLFKNRADVSRFQGANALETRALNFFYNKDQANEVWALKEINAAIKAGEFVGITGATGSGKSTLVQHFNGLLLPYSGRVLFKGEDVKKLKQSELARRVGIVFQNPNHQLFAENVFKEVAFGLEERGVKAEALEQKVKRALQQTGLDYERFKDRHPQSLSGGEQIRLAIAAILALDPEVLILDETLLSLDPVMRRDFLGHLEELNRAGITVIVVSHRLRCLAKVHRILVLGDGQLIKEGSPAEIFYEHKGADVPPIPALMAKLGLSSLGALTVEQAQEALLKLSR